LFLFFLFYFLFLSFSNFSLSHGSLDSLFILQASFFSTLEEINNLSQRFRHVLSIVFFFIDKEAEEESVDTGFVDIQEEGGNDEGHDGDQEEGEETRFDGLVVSETFLLDEGEGNHEVDTDDKQLDEEDGGGGEHGQDDEASSVGEEELEGLVSGNAEVGVFDGGDDEGILGDDADDLFNVPEAALGAAEENLGSDILLGVLQVVFSDVGEDGADELDDGDEEGTPDDGTHVVPEGSPGGTRNNEGNGVLFLSSLDITDVGLSVIILILVFLILGGGCLLLGLHFFLLVIAETFLGEGHVVLRGREVPRADGHGEGHEAEHEADVTSPEDTEEVVEVENLGFRESGPAGDVDGRGGVLALVVEVVGATLFVDELGDVDDSADEGLGALGEGFRGFRTHSLDVDGGDDEEGNPADEDDEGEDGDEDHGGRSSEGLGSFLHDGDGNADALEHVEHNTKVDTSEDEGGPLAARQSFSWFSTPVSPGRAPLARSSARYLKMKPRPMRTARMRKMTK